MFALAAQRIRSAAILLILVFMLLPPGCAAKPGTRVAFEGNPTVEDPTGTHGVTVLGFDRDTTVNGPLGTETSKLTDAGMQETNTGSALKQRVTIVVLADGTIRAGGSAASDLNIGEVTSTWTPGPDGVARTLTFRNVATNNTSVQRAVNEAVGLLIAQYQRASDNERAVLIADLETRAKVGESIAGIALSAIKAGFGLP